MKATDFNLSRDMRFDPKRGITEFRGSRLVIFDAGAIGFLRQKLIGIAGREQARQLFLELGYQHGYADFLQMKMNYQFDTEMDLLAAGPVIHTWEGIVQATPKEIHFDRKTGDFFFTGVWTNSYEAEQHLMFGPKATEPVCWSLMGYASGWCTAFFDKPLIAIEPVCVGKGDDRCEWKIQSPEVWGATADPYLEVYRPFFDKLGSR